MNRLVVVLVAAAVVTTLVLGSGSFSAVTADRGISVDTVGDEDAYMGLLYDDLIVLSGTDLYENETVVTIRNQFTVPVDATVELDADTSSGLDVENGVQEFSGIGVGGERDVTIDLECVDDGEQSATVDFNVTVNGSDVFAQTVVPRTVEFDVTCPSSDDGSTAISFVAVCDVSGTGSVDVRSVSTDEDGDPTEVRWETDEPVDLVVTKAGSSQGAGDESGPGIRNHTYDNATSGTVTADGREPGADQSPSSPCPDGSSGVKFEWDGDEFQIEDE